MALVRVFRSRAVKSLLDRCVSSRSINLETRPISISTKKQYLNVTVRRCSTQSMDADTSFKESDQSVVSYNINSLNRSIDRLGRVDKSDVLNLFDLIKTGTPTSDKIILLLRSCGPFLAEETPSNRMLLVHNVWKYVKSSGMEIDVSVFNVLLRSYLENEHNFAPTMFLEEMKSHGIEPNKVTYQRLIKRYCDMGDVKGAGNILQLMKDKAFPVGESVMNSLIKGHIRAGDISGAENMLNMMKNLNIEPTQASYTALLSGYAEMGNTEKMFKTFEELKSKNMTLNYDNYFVVIKSLASGRNEASIPEVLQMMSVGPRFTVTTLNNVMDLLNHNYVQAAYDVFSFAAHQASSTLEPVFLRQLITNKTGTGSLKNIKNYCRMMINDRVDSNAFLTAVHVAYTHKKFGLGLQLLQAMYREGISTQPHYFWPAIVNAGKEDDRIGMEKVLRIMENVNCPVSEETLTDFIFPNIDSSNPVQLFYFIKRVTKYSTAFIINSMMPYFLGLGRYEDAAQLVSRNPTDLDGRRISKPLAAAAVKQQNLDTIMNIVEHMKPALDNNKKIQDFYGDFLLHCSEEYRNNISDIKPILNAMLAKKLFISQSSIESFKEKFEAEISSEISDALRQLVSTEDDLSFQYFHKADKTEVPEEMVSDVEKVYSDLKEKGMYTYTILRKLIFLHYKLNNFDRLMELKKEFEEYGFKHSSTTASVILQMYAKHNKMEEAAEFRKQLEASDPFFKDDPSQFFDYVRFLVTDGKIEDAVHQLQLITEKFESINKYDFQSQIARVLGIVSSKGDVEGTFKIFDAAKRCPSFEISKLILDLVMRSLLVGGELERGLEFFKECSFVHGKCPLAKDLMIEFIKKEDTANLKTVMNVFVKCTGELLGMHNLGFAFVECGKVDQAIKIFETPGITALNDYIRQTCRYYYRKNFATALENLRIATKNLNEVNQDPMYSHLLKLYREQGNEDLAQNLLNDRKKDTLEPGQSFQGNDPSKVLFADEIALRESLAQKDIKKGLELYQLSKERGYKLSNQTFQDLLECLLESGQTNEIIAVLKDSVANRRFINRQIIDKVVNRLCHEGDFDQLHELNQNLLSRLSAMVKLRSKFIIEMTKQGGPMAFFDWLGNDSAKVELYFKSSAELLKLMKENPEVADQAFSVAKNAAAVQDNCAPLGVVWMYHVSNKDFEKAQNLIQEYPDLKKSLPFSPLLVEHIKDEEFIRKLLSLFEEHESKPLFTSRIKAALVYPLLNNGKVDEALSVFEDIKNSEHSNNAFTYVLSDNILSLQDVGKQVPAPIHEYLTTKFKKWEQRIVDDTDITSSSSDSSSDEDSEDVKK